MRIPTMPITHSDLMAITIPSDADHRRSEATLGCTYHAELIGIRQSFCCASAIQTVGRGGTGCRGTTRVVTVANGSVAEFSA